MVVSCKTSVVAIYLLFCLKYVYVQHCKDFGYIKAVIHLFKMSFKHFPNLSSTNRSTLPLKCVGSIIFFIQQGLNEVK